MSLRRTFKDYRAAITPVPVLVPVLIILVIVMMMVMMIVIVIVIVPVAVSKDPLAAHDCVAGLCCTDSMRPTAIAAPKPLSILTTVTPDAQLVSMAKSAVKPDSAVP